MTEAQARLARLWLFETRNKINGEGSYIVGMTADEHSALAALFARAEELEQEEAEARELLTFLGSEAAAFDFERYHEGERDILRPALERRGFTGVSFYMGEEDSFGPLSRGCVATSPTGKRVRFYYG